MAKHARSKPSATASPSAPSAVSGGTKRAEIIAATIAVLAREGLSDTTTRKIAAEAGVNQAMISYYFGGKDELLFAALEELMQLTAKIARAAAPAGQDPDEALAQAITAFWVHVETRYELQIMQYELTLYALRRPESAWLARAQYAGYTAVVAELTREVFEAAGRQCALPYDDLARFIVGGLDGLILQFVSDRDPIRAHTDVRRLIHTAIALANGVVTAPLSERRSHVDEGR